MAFPLLDRTRPLPPGFARARAKDKLLDHLLGVQHLLRCIPPAQDRLDELDTLQPKQGFTKDLIATLRLLNPDKEAVPADGEQTVLRPQDDAVEHLAVV